ncbi:MAG: AMP-binding protein [Acidimicrobiia bacterium]|nr:AMP-binding protein [Acidimicrobiia bacterium]
MEFQLADIFEAAAERIPDRMCLAWGGKPGEAGSDSTNRSDKREAVGGELNYGQVDRLANQAAHLLRSVGVRPGDHVVVHGYNHAQFMIVTLACFKIAAVPINASYRYTAPELAYVFTDAAVSVVVTESDLAEVVRAASAHMERPLNAILTFGSELAAACEAQTDARPEATDRSADNHYILYTGGTTGMPKGVVWRHEDIFFGALGGGGVPRQGFPALTDPADAGRWAEMGNPVRVRMPLCPLIHGGAQWVALTTILSGGTLVLATDRSFDGATAWSLAERYAVELIMVIGDAVARPLLDSLGPTRHRPLGNLRFISSSGAPLTERVREELTAALPQVRILDRYGASETGGHGRILEPDASGRLRLRGDATTAVIDDDGRPVLPGSSTVGLLARRGHIPLEYWNDPAKTATTFPVHHGVRWAVPGDQALVEADGTIVVLGRGSMVINTGGEKVFPEEVEAVIKQLPEVNDCLVVGLPDERFGQRVVAVLSLRDVDSGSYGTSSLRRDSVEPGADGSDGYNADRVRAHCRTQLAGYKVPKAFVVVDHVERKITGKADYAWARQAASRSGV